MSDNRTANRTSNAMTSESVSTGTSQDAAELWASLNALALELPEEVWRDHRNKVRAALLTAHHRAAVAEEAIRKIDDWADSGKYEYPCFEVHEPTLGTPSGDRMRGYNIARHYVASLLPKESA